MNKRTNIQTKYKTILSYNSGRNFTKEFSSCFCTTNIIWHSLTGPQKITYVSLWKAFLHQHTMAKSRSTCNKQLLCLSQIQYHNIHFTCKLFVLHMSLKAYPQPHLHPTHTHTNTNASQNSHLICESQKIHLIIRVSKNILLLPVPNL